MLVGGRKRDGHTGMVDMKNKSTPLAMDDASAGSIRDAEEDDEVTHRDGDDSGDTCRCDEDERQAQRAALARRTRNEHAALRRRFMR